MRPALRLGSKFLKISSAEARARRARLERWLQQHPHLHPRAAVHQRRAHSQQGGASAALEDQAARSWRSRCCCCHCSVQRPGPRLHCGVQLHGVRGRTARRPQPFREPGRPRGLLRGQKHQRPQSHWTSLRRHRCGRIGSGCFGARRCLIGFGRLRRVIPRHGGGRVSFGSAFSGPFSGGRRGLLLGVRCGLGYSVGRRRLVGSRGAASVLRFEHGHFGVLRHGDDVARLVERFKAAAQLKGRGHLGRKAPERDGEIRQKKAMRLFVGGNV